MGNLDDNYEVSVNDSPSSEAADVPELSHLVVDGFEQVGRVISGSGPVVSGALSALGSLDVPTTLDVNHEILAEAQVSGSLLNLDTVSGIVSSVSKHVEGSRLLKSFFEMGGKLLNRANFLSTVINFFQEEDKGALFTKAVVAMGVTAGLALATGAAIASSPAWLAVITSVAICYVAGCAGEGAAWLYKKASSKLKN